MNAFKKKSSIGIKRKLTPRRSNGNTSKKKKDDFFDVVIGNKDEEEILGSDQEEEINKSDNEENEKEEIEETADEKRHRLAQEFINKLGGEVTGEESDNDLQIDQKIKEQAMEAKKTLKRNIAASLFNIRTDNLLYKTFKGHQLSVTCAVLSTDNKFVYAASKDCCIIKWDVETGKKKIITFRGSRKDKNGDGHKRQVLALAISTDGKYLASGGKDKLIKIWDAVKNVYVDTFQGHKDSVTALAFHRGTHQLYSGSSDRLVKLWNVDTMNYVDDLFGHQSEITCLDALFRERAVTSSYDRTLRFWKIPEESQLVFQGQASSIDCVAMINEELFISGSQDGSICLWSAQKKKPLLRLQNAHQKKVTDEDDKLEQNWITSVAACPFTDLVATGSSSGEIKIWKCTDNVALELILSIPVEGFINSLCFNKEGTFLLAGIGQEHKLGRWSKIQGVKNTVKLFKLPSKEN